MDRQILNLALLRGEQITAPTDHESSPDVPQRRGFTRRRLLGVGSVAAFGFAPMVRALGSAVRGPFEMVGDRHRLEFQVAGRPCWVIDPARFGGRARLSVQSSRNAIHLALRDAEFPGTELPADFDCTLKRGLRGWSMDLRMKLGGLRCDVPFEHWLAGRAPARALGCLDGVASAIAGVGVLRLGGIAIGELDPDWTLRLQGDNVAELDALSQTIVSDGLRLRLLDDAEPSLLSAPPQRRTLLSIDRGARTWDAIPRREDVGGWEFGGTGNAFDQVSIETGLGRHGGRSAAFVAEASGVTTGLALSACATSASGAGNGGIPLRAARFAVAVDGDGRQAALMARFDENPIWLHGGAGSLQIADREDVGPFELVTLNGVVQEARIEPALVGMYLPIAGAISEPTAAREGSTLRLIHDPSIAQPADATSVRFDPLMPQDPARAMLVAHPRVSVIRHQDLLHLEFEFINMKIEEKGGKRAAVRAAGTPYLVVHFPPQNIAEQAFFETVTPPVPPTDPDAPTSDEHPETVPVLPVKARFSGPSRLAYRVPSEVGQIPLDIETLLKAMTDYDPSLVGTALPGKEITDLEKIVSKSDLEFMQQSKLAKAGGMRSSPDMSIVPVSISSVDEPFANRPAGMVRSRVEKASPIAIKRPAGRISPAALGTLRGGGSLSAANRSRIAAASSRAATGRSAIEDKYSIDVSDISINANTAIDFGAVQGLYLLRPKLEEPGSEHTSIESPFRLMLSPNVHGRWAHSLTAVEHDHPVSERKHTELWHTRLGVKPTSEASDWSEEYSGSDKVDERPSFFRTVRAVWYRSPSGFRLFDADLDHFDATKPADEWHPFRMSLDEMDRHNIVHLSANFYMKTDDGKTYEPLTIKVDRLMLTSLGSWMNVRGAWNPPMPLSVEEWRHRGTMGRDHYVRVVYKGYLWPFGHRASLIKVTERKLQMTKWGHIAYLRQRMFIVVRQPEKNFRTSKLMRKNGEITLDNSTGEKIDLQFPFTNVRILTVTTPNIEDPSVMTPLAGQGQEGFIPFVGGKPYRFRIVATDTDNQESEFTMPLAFVENSIRNNTATLTSVKGDYDARMIEPPVGFPAGNVLAGTAPFQGQKIAYGDTEKVAETAYETERIVFSAEIPKQSLKLPPDQPRFYPVVVSANLSIPAIKHLAGNGEQTAFKYASAFLQHEWSASNAGKLFLDLAKSDSPIALNFDDKGDRSGGFAKPNMNITGLSRALGPVAGDPADVVSGKFDPEKFFSGLNAKLFGVLDLWTIVGGLLNNLGLDKAPQFVTEALTAVQTLTNDLNALKSFLSDPAVGSFGSAVKNDVDNVLTALGNILTSGTGPLETALSTFRDDVVAARNALPTVSFDPGLKRSIQKLLVDFAGELEAAGKVVEMAGRILNALTIPDELKVTLEWAPALNSWPDDSKPLFKANDGAKFRLGAEIVAKTNFKSAPKFELYCTIEKFSLILIGPIAGFIALHFKRLGFFANSAAKADIICDFDRLEFIGVLSFIETLRSLIPLDGFSDPPALDISEKGIDASFSIALPNIAFGVFALSNLSLGAGFTVPFIGDPLSFRFNFCTRDNPFTLQISFIGGGGFFGITINPKGVHILEAAFEVGITLSMDFGVASGSVYAMAGVYFKMENDECELTGYFRVGGEVNVLGIINVSIELYLSMTYEFATGKLVGRATLTISIEIFFFDIDVELSCEKKFAGSNGDPTFAELMAPYDGQNLLKPGTKILVEPWKEYVAAFAW